MCCENGTAGNLLLEEREKMKYIDKMNLPQYKYYNNMLEREEERKELISTAMTGEHVAKMGSKRERNEGFMLLGKIRKELPEFLYCCEEDQQRCRQELSVNNIRKLARKMDVYLSILLILPFFQGDPMEKKIYTEKDDMPNGRQYRYEEDTGKYYLSCTSIPKLLLISEELYQNYGTDGEPEGCTIAELDRLLSEDVNYIIYVQCSAQKDVVYLAEKNDGLFLHVLDRAGASKLPMEKALHNGKGAVLLCLKDYLQKMEQEEQLRKKYGQEHWEKKERDKKRHIYEQYEDKNAIKVFDIKKGSGLADYAGICFLHGRGSYRKTGYEMMPHTRKGHYRTYKNGKTVYVKSSVIHKEKYTGVQTAHRMNQKEVRMQEQEEEAGNIFTQGMGM